MRALRIAVLLAAAATGAAADEADDLLQALDRDGDGVLSRGEVADAALFASVDTDRDGRLTRDEIARYLRGAPAGNGKEPAKPAPPQRGGGADGAREEPRSIPERVADFLRRFDRDGDGEVDAEELPVDGDVLAEYDRTRDGAWNEREVRLYVRDRVREAKRNPRPQNFFALFDLDRDGRVTRREYDGPPEFFRDHDHDRDRVVTEEELARGSRRAMRGEGAAAPEDGPTPGEERGLLERHDANGDRRITREELGGASNVFDRLDRNRDGVLSGSEVR